MASPQALQKAYPWTTTPLISLAPMRLIATAPLAVSVSSAGGLGFLGCGTDSSLLSSWLDETTSLLQKTPIPEVPQDILPVGVGFICWGASLPIALSTIEAASSKPAAIWLFAPKDPNHLLEWTTGCRKASNGKSKIWIQVGTVAMALEVAATCTPDVLVIQGSDAGGHGLAQSSSIISLLPECSDALSRSGYGHIPLIAAGGVMDGRGTAAALALGAHGISMGTRFLATPEAVISTGYKSAIIAASDGGVTTARTTVYDKIRGTVGWPEAYNARGVLNRSFWDSLGGMGEDENRKLYEREVGKGDEGWGNSGRMTTYAGTGVGLVRGVVGAGEVVRKVGREARERLERVRSYL